MHVRRCEILFLEPNEVLSFSLPALLGGGDGLVRQARWLAYAPHLPAPVPVDAAQRELLGTLSPGSWRDEAELDAAADVLESLVTLGLVLSRDSEGAAAAHRERDERQRGTYWHPLAALLNTFSRWDGVDTVGESQRQGTDTAAGLLKARGEPPLVDEGLVPTLMLPAPQSSAFDDLLQARTTCRNFDDSRALPQTLFSTLLARVLGNQGRSQADGLVYDKRNTPSGGGLHPMQALLVVRNVEGVPAGLYRYLPQGHGLVAVPPPPDMDAFVMDALGQQEWFANAHCLVALVPAAHRTFWKYRRHAKGYRVLLLEAGHVSQTLYLAATDLGLGAFITAAINEAAIERAFELDPVRDTAVAICGFGWRAGTMHAPELDPLRRVWPAPSVD